MKGPDDFARPRYLSLLLVENALRVLQRQSHESDPDGQEPDMEVSGRQSFSTERITPSEGHSFAETAIRGCLWRDDDSRAE